MTRSTLSRREREIVDILYRKERITVSEVREAMNDSPSYSSVRSTLRVLVQKGVIACDYDGPKHVFWPVVPKRSARLAALKHLVETFFEGSPGSAMATLLDETSLSNDDLEILQNKIDAARGEKPQ